MAIIAGIAFDNTRKSPGVARESPAISIAGASRIYLEFTQTATDFDADSSEYTVEVWLSADSGQNWKLDTTAKCLGNTRAAKSGGMHFVELRCRKFVEVGGVFTTQPDAWPAGTMAKIRFTTGRNARVGLRTEVEIV